MISEGKVKQIKRVLDRIIPYAEKRAEESRLMNEIETETYEETVLSVLKNVRTLLDEEES